MSAGNAFLGPADGHRIDGQGGMWSDHDGFLTYVADGTAGMLIFDIIDPGAPVLMATVDNRGKVNDLFVSGDYLYAGTLDWIEVLRKMPAGL